MNASLFRSEVVEARQHRLQGEVVLKQPVRTHMLVLLLVGIIALLTLWVGLGTYTRSEAARGILATKVGSAKVVAVRPGQVTELLVGEGDLVRAGQRIATIRTEQANENGVSAIGESLAAIENQQQLTELQVQLAARRAASDRSRLTATITGVGRQRADLATQISLQEESVASTRAMVERIERLLESGFISQIEVERRRQAWIVARQQLAQLHQQRNSLEAESSRASAELSRVVADSDSDVAAAHSSAETLAQQRARLRGERAYTIVAPISGRVAALQTAIGRIADPTVPLMEIVPESSALSVHVYAPTRAIGFVRPGQEVRLLYDAFPYQRFGSFSGRISRISRTVIDPRHLAVPLGIEEPVYRIEITPDAQAISAHGASVPLQPGMTLTANIILDRRTFLDWLLAPLNAVVKRNAGRPA